MSLVYCRPICVIWSQTHSDLDLEVTSTERRGCMTRCHDCCAIVKVSAHYGRKQMRYGGLKNYDISYMKDF